MAEMKDTQQDREKVLGLARYWQNELEQADQFERDWRERGMRVVERYRDEREGRRTSIQFSVDLSDPSTAA